MADIIIGNWNDTAPAAPGGSDNVHFQIDRSGDIPQVSASVKRATTLVYGTVIYDASGSALKYLGADGAWHNIIGLTGAVGIVIDGGASTPSTGSKGFVQIPYSGTITQWTMLGNDAGSAQITIKKATYAAFPTTASIVAAAPPILTASQKNNSVVLTGWTTAVTAGDIWEFNLDSVVTIARLFLEVQITKS